MRGRQHRSYRGRGEEEEEGERGEMRGAGVGVLSLDFAAAFAQTPNERETENAANARERTRKSAANAIEGGRERREGRPVQDGCFKARGDGTTDERFHAADPVRSRTRTCCHHERTLSRFGTRPSSWYTRRRNFATLACPPWHARRKGLWLRGAKSMGSPA